MTKPPALTVTVVVVRAERLEHEHPDALSAGCFECRDRASAPGRVRRAGALARPIVGARGSRVAAACRRFDSLPSVAQVLATAMPRIAAFVGVVLVALSGCGGGRDRSAEPAAKRLAPVLQAKLDAKREEYKVRG